MERKKFIDKKTRVTWPKNWLPDEKLFESHNVFNVYRSKNRKIYAIMSFVDSRLGFFVRILIITNIIITCSIVILTNLPAITKYNFPL